jgi:hypothetical protein
VAPFSKKVYFPKNFSKPFLLTFYSFPLFEVQYIPKGVTEIILFSSYFYKKMAIFLLESDK